VANSPPRNVEIKGQDHMLSYITPEEGGILQLLGGSGAPGPMGIPSFYGMDFGGPDSSSQPSSSTYSGNDDEGNSQDSFDYYAGSDNRPSSVLTADSDPIRSVEASRLIDSGTNVTPNVFDLGGGVGDFAFGAGQSPYKTYGSQFSPGGIKSTPTFLNPRLAEMYKQQEIARTGVNLNKNPFVDSIFTDLAKKFGTEIDRTGRGDLGKARVQEINDLRARQAFGLPSLNTKDKDGNLTYESYGSNDFEIGRDTQQGMVKELPISAMEKIARAALPGGFLLPRSGAPEQSQMYRDAQGKANEPGIISEMSDAFTQVSDAVKDMLGFAKNPRGGYSTDDMGDDYNNDENTPERIRPTGTPTAVDPEPYVGKSFLPSNIDNLLNSNKVKQNNTQYNTVSSSRKPVDFSAIDKGLDSVRSGIANINRNRY